MVHVAEYNKITLNLCCPQPTGPASSQKIKKKKNKYKKAAKTKTVESSQPLLSLPTLAVWRWELNYLPDLTHTEPDSYEIPLTGYWVHANKIFVHQYPLLSFEFNYPKSTADPETHR